jgi:hypothetical protein
MMNGSHPEKGATTMLRKLALAVIACGALGTTALLPTSASAWYFHGGFHRWGGPRIVVAPAVAVYGHGWCYYHPFRCGR